MIYAMKIAVIESVSGAETSTETVGAVGALQETDCEIILLSSSINLVNGFLGKLLYFNVRYIDSYF